MSLYFTSTFLKFVDCCVNGIGVIEKKEQGADQTALICRIVFVRIIRMCHHFVEVRGNLHFT